MKCIKFLCLLRLLFGTKTPIFANKNRDMDKLLKKYLSLYNVESIDRLTDEQLKDLVSIKYLGTDKVFRFGTESEIKELIAISREAIKQNKSIFVWSDTQESCNGDIVKKGKLFSFKIL